jgi:hypothetical protein
MGSSQFVASRGFEITGHAGKPSDWHATAERGRLVSRAVLVVLEIVR